MIVSAELVLIGTILVLGMLVGLTVLSYAINAELEDIGSAIGRVNQTHCYDQKSAAAHRPFVKSPATNSPAEKWTELATM